MTNIVTHLLQEFLFSQYLSALIIFTFGRHHMFIVLLRKLNRLFHQNRSQDSTLPSVLLNTVLTVSLILIFFIVRDIQSDYHQHLTRWLTYVSCAFNFVALKCWKNCRTSINSLLNWTPAFAHLEPARCNLQFFFIFLFLSHFKTKKIENFYFHQQRFRYFV